MTYKRLVDQAEAMVSIVHKKYLSGNMMAYPALLLGVFRIESYPGAGHNYQAVIDAIHNCYARDNTSGIDIGYKEGRPVDPQGDGERLIPEKIYKNYYNIKRKKNKKERLNFT